MLDVIIEKYKIDVEKKSKQNIYKYEDRVETATGFSNKYYCVDNEGLDTVITVVTPKEKATLKQIYIANDEMMIQYDLIYLGENK